MTEFLDTQDDLNHGNDNDAINCNTPKSSEI